jgi:NNP family nitrate/nitrite transporter-like MFS transporter
MWYPIERQTRAFDVLGVGIAGAAVTQLFAPALLVSNGWRVVAQIWAAALLFMGAFLWFALREDSSGTALRGRAEYSAPL